MLAKKTWRIVAIRQIRQSFLPAKVLFYTVHTHVQYILVTINSPTALQLCISSTRGISVLQVPYQTESNKSTSPHE